VDTSEQAQTQVHAYVAEHKNERIDHVDFGIAVGAAVPRQITLHELPAERTSALGKYQGDQYLLVSNQLVIVEPQARRIVAIMPNVS
jgi:hypothetical protein